MLEVHPTPDGFAVLDTKGGERIIKLASRADADELTAALQRNKANAVPERWWHIDQFSGTH